MPEVQPRFKDGSGGRPWACKHENVECTRTKPCPRCRGARNRRSGMRKQREARKALERVTGVQANRFLTALGNEEMWVGLPVRIEVKSGGIAKPVDTKCRASEEQANAARSIGDARPFLAVFMPNGMTDGWFCGRLSQLRAIVDALAGME